MTQADSVKLQKFKQLKQLISLNKLVLWTCLLVVIYFGYGRYDEHKTEQAQTSVFITSPQAGDIYFLDFRLLSDTLASKNKYRLAKVIRVSNESIAIVYGSFFYRWQYSVINSIQYGDLSNSDYFTSVPEYISFNEMKEMRRNGALYLIKRPRGHQLYGNFVRPI